MGSTPLSRPEQGRCYTDLSIVMAAAFGRRRVHAGGWVESVSERYKSVISASGAVATYILTFFEARLERFDPSDALIDPRETLL